MHAELLFPSDYVRQADLDGKDVTKTIKAVVKEELCYQGGARETKPVLVFEDTPKKLVLGKTTMRQIARLHGYETNDWPGKQITMFADPEVYMGKEKTGGVRIRGKVKG
jgi:hypothetical protein